MMFDGLRVIVSPYALETTQERLFPASRHRSKRILKKLIKRFGGEFRQQPCIFRTHDTLIIHPSLLPALREAIPGEPFIPPFGNPQL